MFKFRAIDNIVYEGIGILKLDLILTSCFFSESAWLFILIS